MGLKARAEKGTKKNSPSFQRFAVIYGMEQKLGMKTIHIFRHAKSDWSDLMLSDMERPLKKRGVRDVGLMAEALLQSKVPLPEVWLCSPAKRSLDTAAAFIRALPENKEVQIEPALYFQGVEAIQNVIAAQADAVSALALVGHNPDMENWVRLLYQKPLHKFPTCGHLMVQWKQARWSLCLQMPPDAVSLLIPAMLR